jgi:hypothetical protein
LGKNSKKRDQGGKGAENRWHEKFILVLQFTK